jgi:hypothetical protein
MLFKIPSYENATDTAFIQLVIEAMNDDASRYNITVIVMSSKRWG